jgi:hypothetical protein
MEHPSKPLVPVPLRTGTKGGISTGSRGGTYIPVRYGPLIPVRVTNRYERVSAQISG